MEDQLLRTMLFDFFGELLTEKQRHFFDLHYNEDMSLSEIADSEGVSRQAVWDIIRRAEDTLRNIEEKTGLVSRFLEQQRVLSRLKQQIDFLLPMTEGEEHLIVEHIGKEIQELSNGV